MACMAEPKVTFGEEVRQERHRKRMSQEQLAEALGISREAVSKIERGDTKRPGPEILKGIEETLGLSRLRFYQLTSEVDLDREEDVGALLQYIAALPTHEERMEAWRQLPVEVRDAITTLMQDVLRDAMQLLQGQGEQAVRRRER
jgi:transcriptional regulator with XRE-family HTH domain